MSSRESTDVWGPAGLTAFLPALASFAVGGVGALVLTAFGSDMQGRMGALAVLFILLFGALVNWPLLVAVVNRVPNDRHRCGVAAAVATVAPPLLFVVVALVVGVIEEALGSRAFGGFLFGAIGMFALPSMLVTTAFPLWTYLAAKKFLTPLPALAAAERKPTFASRLNDEEDAEVSGVPDLREF